VWDGGVTLAFMTHDALAQAVQARMSNTDPAHDFQHVLRVAANARSIASAECADASVVIAAALCHELFNYPKDHPDSHRSGEVCAEHARALLLEVSYPREQHDAVCDAIRVHGFSRGIVPDSLDARVLQDADRLDAIGAIGIARCFATCASMRRPFYEANDPFCERREPDDKRWGLDHFYKKLLRIPDVLHTDSARAMARDRERFMEAYLAQLRAEIA
jgi:uncharacterized protein